MGEVRNLASELGQFGKNQHRTRKTGEKLCKVRGISTNATEIISAEMQYLQAVEMIKIIVETAVTAPRDRSTTAHQTAP